MQVSRSLVWSVFGILALSAPDFAAAATRAPLPLLQGESESDVSKIKVRILSLTTLMKQEKKPGALRKLHWTRGVAYYQLSKVLHLDPKHQDAAKADAALKSADEDLAFVENSGTLSETLKSQVISIRGIIAISLGHYDEGRARLREALALNPKSESAVNLSLYLADDAYYGERLDEALAEYSRLLSVMSPKSKARAQYQIAWIYLKKNKPAEAEKILLTLAAMPPQDLGDLRKSVLADLAVTAASLRSDVEVLKMMRGKLTLKTDEEVEFLNQLILALQSEKKSVSPATYDRMLEIEKRPFERLSLRLQRTRQEHRDSLTEEFSKRFAEMRKDFESHPDAVRADLLKKLGPEIQAETELMVSRLSDQLSLAVRKGEAGASSRHGWATSLKNQMKFLDGTFTVKARVELYKLWLDVCAADSDWTCVLERVARVGKDQDLAALREQTRLEEITALEALAKSDPKTYRPQLIAALAAYVGDSKRPEWNSVAKRLIAFYVNDGQSAKALPLLTRVDEVEKTEESYYRLQLARFQDDRDADLVKDDRSKSFPTKRVTELLRESHLRMAQKASKSETDFTGYESHLKEYLARTDDESKKIPLLRGYYGKLESKGDFAKLNAELRALSPQRRFHKELQEFPRRSIARLIESGDVSRVPEMIGPLDAGTPEDLRFTDFLARLSVSPEKEWTRVETLKDPKQKTYVLGLLALGLPEAMEAFNRKHPGSPKDIRDMTFLSLRLRSCDRPLALTDKQRNELGDAVPLAFRPQPILPVEKSIERVKFVSAKKLTKSVTERMMKTLDEVRAQRKSVMPALKGQVPAVQIRVLDKAAALEKGAVDMLLGAPLPAGLSDAQKTEYSDGVKKIAEEFTQQNEQFSKAAEDIRGQVKALEDKERTPVKRPASMDSWPWPKNPALTAFRTRSQSASLFSDLLVLDLLRSVSKMEDSEYWAARSGLLLEKSPCPAMVDYVYKELSAQGQQDLIKQWSGL